MKSENELLASYKSLLIGEWIADLANTSAFLFEEFSEINWVGFYLMDEGRLLLGPFQGRIACTEIPLGKGVCGTAAKSSRSILVPNVHKFDGHIACDSRSQSEVVVPLILDGIVVGVLDVDSPRLERFSTHDVAFFENIVTILLEKNF